MVTTSLNPRPSDKYALEIVGLKRITLYANSVQTPTGKKKPEPNDLIKINIPIERKNINAPLRDYARLAAIYLKSEPILKKKNLIVVTKKKVHDYTDDFIELLDKLYPNSYYLRTHRGRRAVFIKDEELKNKLVNDFGTRFMKKYPTWILTEAGKPFIEELITGSSTKRNNAIEITTSAVNNEVLLQTLLNNGFYVNARRILQKTSTKRQLWYITLYPYTQEAQEIVKNATGEELPRRQKNIINGEPYYQVKNVYIID